MTLLPMHKEKLGAMISLAAKYGFIGTATFCLLGGTEHPFFIGTLAAAISLFLIFYAAKLRNDGHDIFLLFLMACSAMILASSAMMDNKGLQSFMVAMSSLNLLLFTYMFFLSNRKMIKRKYKALKGIQ